VPQVGVDSSSIEKALAKLGENSGKGHEQDSRGIECHEEQLLGGVVGRLHKRMRIHREMVDPGLTAGVELRISADGQVLSARLVSLRAMRRLMPRCRRL